MPRPITFFVKRPEQEPHSGKTTDFPVHEKRLLMDTEFLSALRSVANGPMECMMVTQELHCEGLACPEPVIRCRNLVEQKHPASLTVFVDNAAASENVTRFLMKNGYIVLSKQEEEYRWSITAHIGENASADRMCPVCQVTESAPAPKKTLVLITTPVLGQGNDELGSKLMENFLATLPEFGDALWRIILLNGGVKLAATSGKSLDSLKKLEASGVDILVCGACLTFYDLLDAKQVGQTTNMLDVVTSLAVADKVIRP